MTKNNKKKAVAQAISTAVALGWVIMQVESAQAATLAVNNLNDSGVGSLRDTINIATSNDVVEFLLGSHPSTINLTSGALAIAKNLTINGPGANLLTISGNNQFPVFDINAADVTLSGLAIAGDISGLAIAGNIKAYNSSNLTFTNSTINGHYVNIDSNLTLINSTINSQDLEINGGLTGIDDSNVTALSRITIGGNLTSPSGNLTISTGSLYINGGNIINLKAGGNITVTADSLVVTGGSQVTIPNSTSGNSGQINGGSNSSGAGGNITVTASDILLRRVPEPSAIADDSNNSGLGGNITINSGPLILRPGAIISKPVPEPSAIAGSILAGSLAWLAKRKQAAFRKAKV
ncbi:MAG: PEP-CTERM sorting domain-containing protein [Nostoc sp.]|uniref:PEP-CTERM sorting domain-containing protein n=1 Tax=Nostoc sp. TaxID=1180 RepID=UPI002FF67177